MLCNPARRYSGEQGLLCLPGREGEEEKEDEDSMVGCARHLENDESSACEMCLGVDPCA